MKETLELHSRRIVSTSSPVETVATIIAHQDKLVMQINLPPGQKNGRLVKRQVPLMAGVEREWPRKGGAALSCRFSRN